MIKRHLADGPGLVVAPVGLLGVSENIHVFFDEQVLV
jgi:hypothetical protein